MVSDSFLMGFFAGAMFTLLMGILGSILKEAFVYGLLKRIKVETGD